MIEKYSKTEIYDCAFADWEVTLKKDMQRL